MKLSFILIGSALLGSALFAFYPQERVLVHSPAGECLLSDRFALRWKHSVEQSLWREDYRRAGRNLLLWRTDLASFGAGTPHDLPLAQQQPTARVRMQTQRFLPVIYWMVSPRSQGCLIENIDADDTSGTSEHERVLPVYAYLPPYSEVVIRVQRQARWRGYRLPQCRQFFQKD